VQHIDSPVNHEAGRNVPVAHDVRIEAPSKLAEILALGAFGNDTDSTRAKRNANNPQALAEGRLVIPANSSHHQSADLVGDGLKIVARCPEDGIVEAVEGTSPDHFVFAVQWHPERSFEEDERSRKIFRALVEAASEKHKELVGEFEAM